jgi:gamma-glutamyltranspeptidase/glutathione hydrolase
MLSSMTPTIIFKDKKPFLLVGSPGGGRIITTVLQTFLNLTEHGKTLQEAIDLPRFHHQWLPDEIQMEKGFVNEMTKSDLLLMGYSFKEISDFGKVDAIMFDHNGRMTAHSDRRGYGFSSGF